MESENPTFAAKTADPEMNQGGSFAALESDSSQEGGALSCNKNKCLNISKCCLLFHIVIFALISTIALIYLIHKSPYEPAFWMFVFSTILFWVLSFSLVGVSYYHRRVREQEDGRMRSPSVIKSVLFVISLICSMAMMILAVKVVCPECFNPTSGLVFQQIRGVTATNAKFMIRNPNVDSTNNVVVVEYRLNDTQDAFTSVNSSSATLLVENDYVAHVEVTGLVPGTAYEWRFSPNPLTEENSRSFKTNPATGTASKFSFYFGSCFLNGFPNFEEAPGFGYVQNLNPDMFFFLGDFIYSDIPYFKNDEVDTYHTLYRNSMRNPGVQSIFANTPNYHMWDDHEIKNDYPDVRPSNLYYSGGSFENAIEQGWNTFLGHGNPPSPVAGRTYFSFEYGDSTFAVIDTRGYRDSRLDQDDVEKSLLGDEQKQWLFSWLLAQNQTSTFKFIFSPVGFTLDFGGAGKGSDNWAAYSVERQEILDFIRDNRIQGVVLLSGDSHMMYATRLKGPSAPATPATNETGIYEFSSSPISAFDNTFGGFRTLIGLSGEPFKEEGERDGDLLYWTKGGEGAISLIGLMRVDTTLAEPTVTVELYESEELRFTKTLTSTQLRLF